MNVFEVGSMNSDLKVGTNADTIFERVISNISTKSKKKINIASKQNETHYVYA